MRSSLSFWDGLAWFALCESGPIVFRFKSVWSDGPTRTGRRTKNV